MILGEKSPFGSMRSTPVNQMDLMSVMWHLFDVCNNFTFAMSSFSAVRPTIAIVVH